VRFLKVVWDQVKGLTASQFESALKRDGWKLIDRPGAQHLLRHPDGRMITVHMHPSQKGGYQPKLLKGMLEQTGWTEEDLRRLKLIR
jgi:predicted RNA binding protein YcfA (HicA-like mRNA interferase family)